MKQFRVAVLIGSLRKASLSRKLARELISFAPTHIKMEIVEIGDLPLYNEDLDQEGNRNKAFTEFREQLKDFDGVLFITPEYNRSVPAALKNALDVGSRPYGQSVWDGKPGAVISHSVGAMGGFGANHHLRQSLVFLNVPVMQQPEAYLSNVGEILNENRAIDNPRIKAFLTGYMESYAKWITTIKGENECLT